MLRPRSISGKVLAGFAAAFAAFLVAALATLFWREPVPAGETAPTVLVAVSLVLALLGLALWTGAFLQAVRRSRR